MSEKPLISVIVPVYNVEEYLAKCIESIINQTYTNLEIILVDDGSTDNSGKICDEYAEKDSRIKVLHKENGGQATARNMALDIAEGDYIGFVDSDDYIALDMYKVLYDSIVLNECDIAMCGRYNVVEDKLIEKFTYSEKVVFDYLDGLKKLLIYDNFDSSPCDKLFKRDVINKIKFPSGYVCEDVDFVFRTLDNSKKIVHCGASFYYYLQRVGSTSRSFFSEKSMGLKIHHKTVYDFIIKKYPFLRCEAEYFYFSRLIVLYRIIVKSGYNGKQKKEIYNDIVTAFWKILRNCYFNMKEKILTVLITLKIYDLICYIKNK